MFATSTAIGTIAMGGTATAAADPVVGQPCTAADLGKRHPLVKSATLTPTITHFKTFFVTSGTTGSQVVTLEHTNQIQVAVGTITQITATFNLGVLGNVQAFVNRTVTKTTSSTDRESTQMTWNFVAPGYYGLFKGTRKVTGEYGSINCGRVDKGGGQYATEWIERPGGAYTTYTVMEEGAIRCEDVVPANSIMRQAQIQLGCDGRAAKEEAGRQRADEPSRGGDVVAPLAVPPGFTCDPGYYRIGTPDRLLNWWNQDGTDEIRLQAWSSSTRAQWLLCQGPVSNGMTEHVIITRYGDAKCLTLHSGETASEGGRLQEESCRTVDDRQRFYLYRDVPGSDKIGFQVKSSGFMAGQAVVANNQVLRQYSMGMADGTGTYILEKIA
ncbi:hypothetical protein SAMN05444920_109100 [Nonomuraea solani]|uniref:Uncharacterized protein n=2 Tax=Nonomuraea solani TaxID=1144553 RepID=A0A1H6EFI1_9ACTN|nr:hypothetical protein SAMN05444920_109100 [Nonomuraea solani]